VLRAIGPYIARSWIPGAYGVATECRAYAIESAADVSGAIVCAGTVTGIAAVVESAAIVIGTIVGAGTVAGISAIVESAAVVSGAIVGAGAVIVA
jgi:hypothetical protein